MMNNNATIDLNWVRTKKARLLKELADLEATERVLMAADSGGQQPPQFVFQAPKSPKYGSKKHALLEIIGASETGQTTPAIIKVGHAQGYPDWKTSNVSPHLSSYKKDGLLSMVDGQWRLADLGRDWLAAQKK